MTRNQQTDWPTLSTIVVALGLALIACKRDRHTPDPASSSLVSSPAPPTAPASSNGAMYAARGVNLCKQTDLEPFADLKVKVLRTEPNTYPRIDTGCVFYLRTASGRDLTLVIEIETFKSVELARPNLSSLRQYSGGMNYDGSVTGIGDEADAFSAENGGRGAEADYMMRARYENMVVKVQLAAYGEPLVAKTTLAEKVRALVEATAKLVPKR